MGIWSELKNIMESIDDTAKTSLKLMVEAHSINSGERMTPEKIKNYIWLDMHHKSGRDGKDIESVLRIRNDKNTFGLIINLDPYERLKHDPKAMENKDVVLKRLLSDPFSEYETAHAYNNGMTYMKMYPCGLVDKSIEDLYICFMTKYEDNHFSYVNMNRYCTYYKFNDDTHIIFVNILSGGQHQVIGKEIIGNLYKNAGFNQQFDVAINEYYKDKEEEGDALTFDGEVGRFEDYDSYMHTIKNDIRKNYYTLIPNEKARKFAKETYNIDLDKGEVEKIYGDFEEKVIADAVNAKKQLEGMKRTSPARKKIINANIDKMHLNTADGFADWAMSEMDLPKSFMDLLTAHGKTSGRKDNLYINSFHRRLRSLRGVLVNIVKDMTRGNGDTDAREKDSTDFLARKSGYGTGATNRLDTEINHDDVKTGSQIQKGWTINQYKNTKR